MVVGSTSVSSISSARSTIFRRNSISAAIDNAGSPKGDVIACPRRILFAPTIAAMVGSDVTNTVAIPALSISFASVDPQRVPVPQVPVRRTASTPASRSSSAISRPNFVAAATVVPFPVVV